MINLMHPNYWVAYRLANIKPIHETLHRPDNESVNGTHSKSHHISQHLTLNQSIYKSHISKIYLRQSNLHMK